MCTFSDIHLICVATAFTLDPIQNLAVAVNPCKPSVTLNWNPPANAAGYVTKYELHDNDSGYHGEEVVNGSTTFTVITRESGLRPLSTFTFKVRAYSGDNSCKPRVEDCINICRYVKGNVIVRDHCS